MKMKNNYKIKAIAASISILIITQQPAHAGGVPTFDAILNATSSVMSAAMTQVKALEVYYKPRADAQGSATAQNTAATTEAVDALAKQSIANTVSQAYQERAALGEAAEAKILQESLPTISQCVEASGNTEGAPKTSAQGGVTRSSRGGGGSPSKIANNVTSSAAAAGNVLKDKSSLQTCHEAIVGAAGCTKAKAQSDQYSKGDSEPRGIKGNIKGLTLANETSNSAEFNNYTFEEASGDSPDGYKVAVKYVSASTLYDAPKVVKDENAMAKNPSYAAMYDSMMTKLNASSDALIDILKMRRKGTTDISGSVAGQAWKNMPDYKKVTGLEKKPANPSMFDIVNYNVLNDYFGNVDAKLDSPEETNKRLALQNYVAWNQYKQQENTNILLSHILVQLTTPVSKQQLDAEFNKTMSYSTTSK